METSPFLYPGRGLSLREASSANVVSDPLDTQISSTGYSEGWGAHDALEFSLDIQVNTGNATGDILLEQGNDATFTTVITHATIAVNGKRVANYKSGGPLTGFFRLNNTSGRVIEVKLQKRIR